MAGISLGIFTRSVAEQEIVGLVPQVGLLEGGWRGARERGEWETRRDFRLALPLFPCDGRFQVLPVAALRTPLKTSRMARVAGRSKGPRGRSWAQHRQAGLSLF
jgi:hypothetical protein